MILKNIYIEDYKSIKNIDWKFDSNLLCLVGQNESGKSNLLEIFKFLEFEYKLNYLKDTNRSSQKYLSQKTPKIQYFFQISESDFLVLGQLLRTPNLRNSGLFQKIIAKQFDTLCIDFSSDSGIGLDIIFQNTINNSIKPESILKNYNSHDVIVNLYSQIRPLLSNILYVNESQKNLYSDSIALIRQNKSKSLLVKLLNLAGVENMSMLPDQKVALRPFIKRININLNKNFVQKFYKQDKSIKFNFVLDGEEVYLEVEDHTEAVYSMDERSEGFRYYFSLLIEMALSKGKTETIFILDEPGLKLHPSGQRDLLNYLEILSKEHKIIYTTHSPFLINRLYPNRVKIVEKDIKNGTVFKNKGFSKNWRPLRNSLGLNIKDSFYYSDKSLIVEGPEDVLFLSSLMQYFNDVNKININTDLFSFIDAGSESNLPSMVQIMIEDDRPILILIDSDSISTFNKLSKKVNEVKNIEMLDLIQVRDFNENAVSIEDLMPHEILQQAVINYANELLESGVYNKRVEGSEFKIDLSGVNQSRYKNSIAPSIKEFFIENDLDEKDWNKKTTPISKVGIAKHFDLVLHDNNFDKSEINFDASIALIKSITQKLSLISQE